MIKNVLLSLEIDCVLANSADLNEMLHFAAFHQGLHYLPKVHKFVYILSKPN